LSRRYDVIVVGAGPAGSLTAYNAAKEGASVLLLDRASFPRDKPCGGGVTIRAASVLPFDVSPVVERTAYNVRFSFRLGRSFVDRYSEPLAHMTQRRCLDEYLVQQAAKAGVDFKDRTSVKDITVDGHKVSVRAGGDVYQSSVLVGADGANGVVAKSTSIIPKLEHLVALEGNVSYKNGIPQYWERTIALDLGGLPGGYGWVFPKGEHLNVGVGAWTRYGPYLRESVAALCRRYGLRFEDLQNLRGHRLPLRLPGSPIAKGPVLLVGDAAGLIDPLSGEGIYAAFLSAGYAVKAIARYLGGQTSDLMVYQAMVDRRIMPDLVFSRKLQEIFNLLPGPYVPLLRYSSRFWHAFCYLIRGEVNYQGFVRQLGPLRPIFDLVATAARRRARAPYNLTGQPR
jgi:geranylgeranyl reductase family protein